MSIREFFSLLALVVAGVSYSGSAAAACSITTGNADFGSRTSIVVNTTAQRTTSDNSFSCSGGLFSFFTSGNRLSSTPTSANNFRLTNSNGYAVAYDIYTNSDYATGRWQQGQQNSSNFFNLLSRLTPNTGTFKLYFQTRTGANVPEGIYRDTVSVRWTWHICTAGVLFCVAYEDGSATTTINVVLTVVKSCLINAAPDIDFGTSAFVGGFNPVNQNVNLTCTLRQPYRTFFTDGGNYDGTWKRMAQGANFLQYNLFIAGGGTAWDKNNKQSGTGSGTAQSLPYTARINSAQPDQPAGAYTDNVSITVEY